MTRWGGAFCFVCCALFLWVQPGWAEIYMYKDSEGNFVFTDSPNAQQIDHFGARPMGKKASKKVSSTLYDSIIRSASRRHKLPFSLIKAVIHAESGFNPRAVSSKGAMGLMQIMPKNRSNLKVSDPYDPYENIMGGSAYLKKLMLRYKGDTRLALAAYNAGPARVKEYGGVPPFPETLAYISKVERLKSYYSP